MSLSSVLFLRGTFPSKELAPFCLFRFLFLSSSPHFSLFGRAASSSITTTLLESRRPGEHWTPRPPRVMTVNYPALSWCQAMGGIDQKGKSNVWELENQFK